MAGSYGDIYLTFEKTSNYFPEGLYLYYVLTVIEFL